MTPLSSLCVAGNEKETSATSEEAFDKWVNVYDKKRKVPSFVKRWNTFKEDYGIDRVSEIFGRISGLGRFR